MIIVAALLTVPGRSFSGEELNVRPDQFLSGPVDTSTLGRDGVDNDDEDDTILAELLMLGILEERDTLEGVICFDPPVVGDDKSK